MLEFQSKSARGLEPYLGRSQKSSNTKPQRRLIFTAVSHISAGWSQIVKESH